MQVDGEFDMHYDYSITTTLKWRVTVYGHEPRKAFKIKGFLGFSIFFYESFSFTQFKPIRKGDVHERDGNV